VEHSTKPLIVGIGGTLRENSSSEKALKIALEISERRGAATLIFSGAKLQLPLYEIAGQHSEEGSELIDALRRADGIIVSSPCYHGGVSGMIKNVIDYAEDMRSDPRVYFSGLPMGCIGCGAGWQGPSQVLSGLRSIGHALRAWPTPMGVGINTEKIKLGKEGCSYAAAIEQQLEIMAHQVVDFAWACGHRIRDG